MAGKSTPRQIALSNTVTTPKPWNCCAIAPKMTTTNSSEIGQRSK